MFYQADASSDIAGLGGASGADILNEFDLSLLEPRLGGGAGGFQAPGLLLDGTWTPKDSDPSFCTDLLFSQDSPTSSDGLSPESFCLDFLPAATDAAYPMEGAPPAPRTGGSRDAEAGQGPRVHVAAPERPRDGEEAAEGAQGLQQPPEGVPARAGHAEPDRVHGQAHRAAAGGEEGAGEQAGGGGGAAQPLRRRKGARS
nr:circumsporozoite protein-like [Penaeus vannamei]